MRVAILHPSRKVRENMAKTSTKVSETVETPATPASESAIQFVETPEALETLTKHNESAKRFRVTHGKKMYFCYAVQATQAREAFARLNLGVKVESIEPRKERGPVDPVERAKGAVAKLSDEERKALLAQLTGG